MSERYMAPEAPALVPAGAGGVQRLTYNVKEAAAALGISTRSMYDLINQEGFPTVKLGGRRLISVELLAEWVRAQAGGGGP